MPVRFLKQNAVSRDRRRGSDGFGGSKREFTWQVQGIGHSAKIVTGAVFCGRCQNVGRRVSFEGLRFTWQPQGIRTMHGSYVLRSKGSIPEKGCMFGTSTFTCRCFCVARAAFRMTSAHDFVAGAVFLKHGFEM